jgi:hypothetical protein
MMMMMMMMAALSSILFCWLFQENNEADQNSDM